MARKVLNGLDLASQKIANLADGSSPADAATFGQLQAAIRGLDWKQSVRAASTGNLTLSAPQTVDGVSLVAGDRVLVKDQTTASTNGIYTVAAGAWVRAVDYDDNTEITAATAVPIESGTVNGDAVFILTTDGTVTVGSTSLAFTRLGGTGVTYTAGTNGGLTLSGSAFSILLDTGSGLILSSGGIKIDPTYSGLAKRYAVNVPTSTTATITHNLATLDVVVSVYEVSTGAQVEPDVVLTSANVVTLTFATAPTTGQYRAVVLG